MENRPILIVDDHPPTAAFLGAALQAGGYQTVVARDGFEGVRMARDHLPALIFMDFLLPELSGLATGRMIRSEEMLSDIPMVAMTAFPFQEGEELFLGEGFDGYLPKPIDIRTLLATAARFCG
ncbi:MAG: response regulator [Magnetospirillum sp. WYHS-4]